MERLDVYLVRNGLVKSREKAIEFIKGGSVRLDGEVITKPSTRLSENPQIEITPLYEFVGRGGVKLQKLIDEGLVSFENLKCLDIGASTGGFTDCMLRNGAKSVVALDVGSDELDDSLREDSRVIVMEGIDIRDVESFPYDFDAISIDVSFISIIKVLPKAFEFLKEDGFIAALIKPQFEVGRGVAKKGIVKDRKEHIRVLKAIAEYIEVQGYYFEYLSHSPIKGGKGNIEYISLIKSGKTKEQMIEKIVEEAFR